MVLWLSLTEEIVKQNVLTEDSWVLIPVASAFHLLDYVVLLEVYKEDIASCWYVIGNRTLQSPWKGLKGPLHTLRNAILTFLCYFLKCHIPHPSISLFLGMSPQIWFFLHKPHGGGAFLWDNMCWPLACFIPGQWHSPSQAVTQAHLLTFPGFLVRNRPHAQFLEMVPFRPIMRKLGFSLLPGIWKADLPLQG